MPFVTNRGQRIHYTLDGDGPLVVLQHGYLSSAADWKTCGYVDVLTEAGFRVACVDSLAHGESDKPTDPDLYALPHRADDIVAVLDDLGADRAHLVGYSMGGWIAGGVAAAPPRAAGVGHDRRLGLRARDRHRHRGLGDVTVDPKWMIEGARDHGARPGGVGHPRRGGGRARLRRRHHRAPTSTTAPPSTRSPCRCCAGTAPRTRTTGR